MKEYMDKLKKEREGIEDDPDKQENAAETQEKQEKPETAPPQAPVPDLSMPRQQMKAKATLFAMQRP